MLRYELHAHVAPSSPCAKTEADAFLAAYAKKGYDGVVVTNHIWPEFEALKQGWENAVEAFLVPYRQSLAQAESYGLQVLLGLELRVNESPNDYLIYGFAPDFLYEHGNLIQYSLAALSKLCKEQGLALFQAHPFRNGMQVVSPLLLDGFEIFNGNPRHDSRNDIARQWCERAGKIGISGSDFHVLGDEAGGGVLLHKRPANESALARMLLSRAFEPITQ